MNKILGVLVTLSTAFTIRRDAAAHRLEKGASTLELVVITAALLAVAIIVTVLITNVVNERSSQIY